jgi:hypothetical protein
MGRFYHYIGPDASQTPVQSRVAKAGRSVSPRMGPCQTPGRRAGPSVAWRRTLRPLRSQGIGPGPSGFPLNPHTAEPGRGLLPRLQSILAHRVLGFYSKAALFRPRDGYIAAAGGGDVVEDLRKGALRHQGGPGYARARRWLLYAWNHPSSTPMRRRRRPMSHRKPHSIWGAKWVASQPMIAAEIAAPRIAHTRSIPSLVSHHHPRTCSAGPPSQRSGRSVMRSHTSQ